MVYIYPGSGTSLPWWVCTMRLMVPSSQRKRDSTRLIAPSSQRKKIERASLLPLPKGGEDRTRLVIPSLLREKGTLFAPQYASHSPIRRVHTVHMLYGTHTGRHIHGEAGRLPTYKGWYIPGYSLPTNLGGIYPGIASLLT